MSTSGEVELVNMVHSAGYQLRTLFECISKNTRTANFIFSKDGFKMTRSNRTFSMCMEMNVIERGILSYSYTHDKASLTIGLNCSELHAKVKILRRGDCLRIRIVRNTQDQLQFYVQIRKPEDSILTNGGSLIRPIHVDEEDYLLETLTYDTKPNISIIPKLFCGSCAALKASKFESVRFTVTEHGVLLEGICTNGTWDHPESFGDVLHIQKSDRKVISTLDVSIITIDILAKLLNMCKEGIFRIFAEDDSPIKIECPIASCGYLNIYLTEPQES